MQIQQDNPERLKKLLDEAAGVTRAAFAERVALLAGVTVVPECITQWTARRRRPREHVREAIDQAARELLGRRLPPSGWPRIAYGTRS